MDERRQHLVEGVQAVVGRLEEAEAILEEARQRFAWVNDHPDFFERLDDFLDR